MLQIPEDQPIYHNLIDAMYARPFDGEKYVIGRVGGSRAPTRVSVEGIPDPDEPPQQRVTFVDLSGDRRVDSVPIRDGALLARLDQALRSGERLVIKGRFVPYGREGADGAPVHLQVEDVAHLERPTALLGATAEELARTDAHLDALAAQGPSALYDHLIHEAFRLLGVVPSRAPRFLDLSRLVVLQALSEGMFEDGTNSRLHLLTSSAPGRGKKVFTQLAELLAPICAVVQPVQLSPPGLTARVQAKPGGGFEASPGVFPHCSGGVCVFEDYHRVNPHHRRAVQGVLMATAEDGRVCTSKAAAASYDAEVGLLLNLNRLSQVQGALPPEGAARRLADLSLSAELLSRIDVLMMMEQGDDAVAVSQQIAVKAAVAPRGEAERAEHAAEARALKLLVARLRDRIPEVELGAVQGEIFALIEDLAVVVRHQCARSAGALDGDGMLRRMANSVRKLVAAQARLAGRSAARSEDVQGAWELLCYKLEVLGWLCGDSVVPQPVGERAEVVARARRGVEVQFLTLLKELGGRRVTLQQAAAALGLSPQAVARELWRRGVQPERGYFTIPTLAAHRQALQQRRLDEEAAAAAAEVVAAAAADAVVAEPAGPVVPVVEEGVPAELFAAPEEEVDGEIQQLMDELRAGPVVPRLPQVPERLGRLLDALGIIEGHTAERVARYLFGVMDAGRPLGLARFDLGSVVTILERAGAPGGAYLDDFLHWVAVEDGEQRALRALAVYAESTLPDDAEGLVARWREERRPQVRQAIEAVVDMLDQSHGRPLRGWEGSEN